MAEMALQGMSSGLREEHCLLYLTSSIYADLFAELLNSTTRTFRETARTVHETPRTSVRRPRVQTSYAHRNVVMQAGQAGQSLLSRHLVSDQLSDDGLCGKEV